MPTIESSRKLESLLYVRRFVDIFIPFRWLYSSLGSDYLLCCVIMVFTIALLFSLIAVKEASCRNPGWLNSPENASTCSESRPQFVMTST